MAVGIKGDRLTTVDPELPDFGPYNLRVNVVKEDERIVLTDLKGLVAQTDLAGRMELVLKEPKPRLTGELRSSRLRLQDVFPWGILFRCVAFGRSQR